MKVQKHCHYCKRCECLIENLVDWECCYSDCLGKDIEETVAEFEDDGEEWVRLSSSKSLEEW